MDAEIGNSILISRKIIECISISEKKILKHFGFFHEFFFVMNRSENMFEDETSKVVQRHVAMSRVGDTKQYVQDLLLKDQTFVYDVIANRKGQIYLCGKVIIFQRNFFFM